VSLCNPLGVHTIDTVKEGFADGSGIEYPVRCGVHQRPTVGGHRLTDRLGRSSRSTT